VGLFDNERAGNSVDEKISNGLEEGGSFKLSAARFSTSHGP
jgi:hypothetical protein